MIKIAQLPSITPTLAEVMRACHLNAALSRSQSSKYYVLGNPKAWLGTAFHKVMRAIAEIGSPERHSNLGQYAERIWEQEIKRLEHEAAAHPLDHRFGDHTAWKGYYLILETLRIRVIEFAENSLPHREKGHGPPGDSLTRILHEKEFSAFSGKLLGRIDLVRYDQIIDYKTGSLFENTCEIPRIRSAYVRQLRIYAYLVYATTGRWPRHGFLYPIAGPPLEVNLEPDACEKEAFEAVRLLDQFNNAIAIGDNMAKFASPSTESCRWCPMKIICPEFWKCASENWFGHLDGEAVLGVLLGRPKLLQNGAAWALEVRIEAGTVASDYLAIAPLNGGIHIAVAQLRDGDLVRIVGLGRRSNGSLFPTQRTVVLPDSQVPLIQFEFPKPG